MSKPDSVGRAQWVTNDNTTDLVCGDGGSRVEVHEDNLTLGGSNACRSMERLKKYMRTGALFYCWICLGLYAEVLGPSLPSFMFATSSSYEEIGRTLSIREVGMFFGSLFGALAADIFSSHRSGTIAVTQLLGAITIVAVPFCSSLWSLSLTLFFSGCSHGALTSNGNPLLGEIWGQRADGPFNFMHSGYGVGGALAPVLLAPFSYPSNFTLPKALKRYLNVRDTNGTQNTDLVYLVPPCTIIAFLCLLAAVFCLSFEFTDHLPRFRGRKAEVPVLIFDDSEDTPMDVSPRDNFLRLMFKKFSFLLASHKSSLILLPFIFLLYFALVGNERVFAKFLYIAAVDGPTKFNSSDSYLLNSIYWTVFCLARILTFVVSLKVSIFLLFGIQLIGTLTMSTCLLLTPPTHVYFFTFTALFGLFKSPLFPSGLSVINKTISLTGLIVFVVNLGSSIGASCLQYLVSYLFDKYSPAIFTLAVTVTAAFLLVIGMGLLFTARFLRRRLANSFDFDESINDASDLKEVV